MGLKCGDNSPFPFPSGHYKRWNGSWIPIVINIRCDREISHKGNHRYHVNKEMYFSWPNLAPEPEK